MRQATRWAVVLTIALATVIAALTLTPPVPVDMPAGSDKSYHFLAFMALALPLSTVRPRWSPALLIAFTAYGAAIEVIQPYVGRSREFADIVADVLGVASGLVLGLLVGTVIRRGWRERLRRDGRPRPHEVHTD